MRLVTQRIIGDPERGDCLSACVASLLDLDLAAVPYLGDYGWDIALTAFLDARGMAWQTVDATDPPAGMAIAVGPSPRRASVKHACLAESGELSFDPHPARAFFGGAPVRYYIVIVSL